MTKERNHCNLTFQNSLHTLVHHRDCPEDTEPCSFGHVDCVDESNGRIDRELIRITSWFQVGKKVSNCDSHHSLIAR